MTIKYLFRGNGEYIEIASLKNNFSKEAIAWSFFCKYRYSLKNYKILLNEVEFRTGTDLFFYDGWCRY